MKKKSNTYIFTKKLLLLNYMQ